MNKKPYWYYDMMEDTDVDEYDEVSYEEARAKSM